MWDLIALGGCAASFALMWSQLRRLDDAPTRFMVFAVWLRFALAAFPEYTTQPIIGSVSINAVFSLVVTLTALALVDRRLYLLRHAVPIYALIGVIVLSGLMNRMVGGMVEFLLRYLYILGLALLTYRAVRLYGADRLLRAMLAAMATPAILLVFSIPMGKYKLAEEDGSISYVGGYLHEAGFSILMLGFLIVASLIRWRQSAVGLALIAYGFAGILLANYRTTIISALPVMLLVILSFGAWRIAGRWRAPLLALGAVGAVASLLFLDALLPARFADIGALLDEGALLSQDPLYFNREERLFFNYRFYLWSLFIELFGGSGLHQWILGMGPLGWEQYIFVYAHNTFVSWLVQFGIVGLLAVTATMLYNLWLAVSGPDRGFALLLTACLGGLLLQNLATEPLWNIEAMILHSFLFGLAWGSWAQGPEPAPGRAALLIDAPPRAAARSPA